MRGCLGAMCIHKESEPLALVPRGLARPPLVPQKLHACHWAHRVSGEGWPETSGQRRVAGDRCPVAEFTFHRDCKSGRQGVVISLGLLSSVDPSSTHLPASQLSPHLMELHSRPSSRGCWWEGSGGGRETCYHSSVHPSPNR